MWQTMIYSQRIYINSKHGTQYKNAEYVVNLYDELENGMHHLAILRIDGNFINDWRHLQRIKNDICGPLRWAVQIYPSEEYLVDSTNLIHLWVAPENMPMFCGFDKRYIAEQLSSIQRPFGLNRPSDCKTFEEVKESVRRSGNPIEPPTE
jgi:hypothetical protein